MSPCLFAAKVLAVVTLGALAAAGCGDSERAGGDGTGSSGNAGFTGGRSGGGNGEGGAGGSSSERGGSGGTSGRGGSAGTSAGAGAAPGSGGSGGVSGNGAMAGESGSSGAAGASAESGGGGTAGSSTGGTVGTPSADCSGAFGEPRVVLDPGLELRIYSPSLSADELELLYGATGVGAQSKEFRRTTRASKLYPFEPGEPVPELDAACAPGDDRTLELTPDGLRAYIVCYDPAVSFSGPLRLARRSDPGAPFVLDAESYGTVGASPSLAAGELTVFSGGFEGGTSSGLMFQREATSDPFGDGIPLESLPPATSPDLSPDELSLFFGYEADVMVAMRENANGAFSAFDVVLDAPDVTPAVDWISPAISEDCRSLYAVYYVADTGAGESSWTLQVVTR